MKGIGRIRTVFNNKFGTPRQGALAPSSQAEFHLAPEWRGKGLFAGLEGFSHVWLLSYFHENKNTRLAGKVHPPRLEGRAIGVLASRSPHRPNSVGLTLARLEKVEGDRLFLSGVDLIDQTPILDIKPYVSTADRPTEFADGWAGEVKAPDMRTEFSPEFFRDLEPFEKKGAVKDRVKFMNLVREVLRLDPRPLAYRARVNERFAIVLDGIDVHARFNDDVFTVISVSEMPAPKAKSPRAPSKPAPRKARSRRRTRPSAPRA